MQLTFKIGIMSSEKNVVELGNGDVRIQIKEQTLKDVAIKIETPLEDKQITRAICCAGFAIFFCILLFCIPFIVCDLFVAYSSDDCVTESHFLTLKTWLEVSAYSTIGGVVVAMMNMVMVYKNKLKPLIIFTIFGVFSQLFYLSWLIVGSVIFWKDVRDCNSLTNDYMYARLIISYIFLGLSLGKSRKSE